MQKSVSLDADVAKAIDRIARSEERSFSQVVNRRLREAFGIKQSANGKIPQRPARTRKEVAA
jgi:predicted transcriptional regulator